MGLNISFAEPAGTPAVFTRQGEDRVFPRGELTYCVHSVEQSAEGVRASLTVRRGGEVLARDVVPLWSARRRSEFAKQFTNGEASQIIEEDLLKIEGALREEVAERHQREEEQRAKAHTGALIPEAEREEALELLRDPLLLLRVEQDLTVMGIVGEDRVKVIAYLIATCRKQPVGQGLAGTFKAGSSAGKSHIVRTVADLMPPDEVREFTHLSPKALYYLGEHGIAHNLVICTEIAGRVEAEYAVRTLISEPFITSAIPVKDEATGRFATETFRVNGPIAYLDTTTSTHLNAENSTRVFELYLDEEEEQTKAIIRQQAREAGPEHFVIEGKRERVRRVHRNAQRLLQPDFDVVIPFAEKLTFPSKDRRARRDFSKLLNLIRVIAFLHQYQRELREAHGRRYIEATRADYALAYELGCPTFTETLDILDRRDRGLLDLIVEKLKNLAVNAGNGLEVGQFDRAMVSKWSGKHRNHLVAPLNRLEEADYLVRMEGSIGKRIVYRLNAGTLAEDTEEAFAGLTQPEKLT